ncbi:phospho-N-acetylmuramoyl-pentapeptide-transferase [Candidatus Marinamargulisbacteria bacterium SCGC AG-343-K17]|nr:phospho-N-acetylmuramoyl-pentapeptide-transferase [Candidatus Marinamargulisbacteria bacterium SCGC AG-343-K17]
METSSRCFKHIGVYEMIWTIWSMGCILSYRWGIKGLRQLSFNQRIYEDSPESHQKKQGTPTMGGCIIFSCFLIGALILNQWNMSTMWVVATTTLFCVIGAVDDGLSLKRKSNKGLSARAKFMCQIIVSSIMVGVLYQWIKPIHWAEALLYVFLLTGTSNATNLTDGVDGLLGSTMLVSLIGMVVVLQSQWMFEEMRLTYIMMASIGFFLLFNWQPAKLFMGDVGSLMLGAFLAAMAISSGVWWMLIGFGAIYIIETLSVIIQVVSYKLRKKRVFLMTPLHHHFELLGMNDRSVVALFATLQAGFTFIQLL